MHLLQVVKCLVTSRDEPAAPGDGVAQRRAAQVSWEVFAACMPDDLLLIDPDLRLRLAHMRDLLLLMQRGPWRGC
jgi:hypothetical protein